MDSNLGFDGGLTCALKVSDLESSLKWYQDMLGFELIYKMKDMGWAELKTPVERVNVGLSHVEKCGGDGNSILTFGVKDIAHARDKLESRNVRFDGPTQTIEGMVKLATFFDPDGNAMMLYEDLQGQPS
jgi:catechol 2,3-dioxygenase-like lactoylglutathione lyase family enzyme